MRGEQYEKHEGYNQENYCDNLDSIFFYPPPRPGSVY